MTHAAEDPILRSARREAIVVLALWLVAMAYSVGYCYQFGYGRDPASLAFVFGFPDWVFWGVLAPWSVCTAISGLFAFVFMTDEDLGQDLPEQPMPGEEASHG